jgi:hypothetical protein
VSTKIVSDAMARVLMAAAGSLVISLPGRNDDRRLRAGARLSQGYLRMARLAETAGYLKIGKRTNGEYWVELTDEGRRALAAFRNGPPSQREQLIELATAAGVDADTMQQRIIYQAWRAHAGWFTAELPGLKAAMVRAHPDKGGDHLAFIEAHQKYEEAKAAVKDGRPGRTRKSKGKNTNWQPVP